MLLSKKKLISCLLTVLYLSSYAQSHIEVRDKDTVAVISIHELKAANSQFVNLSECKEEKDSLRSEIATYNDLINTQKASIKFLKDATDIDSKLLNDKQTVIDLSNKELKNNSRKIKLLKLERGTLIGAVAIAAVKIFIFK